MTRRADLLQRAVRAGLLAIVILSPTQYGLEVARKTYVSIVDPLIWLVFGLWVLSAGFSLSPRRTRYPPLLVWLFLLAAGLSLVRALHPLKGVKDVLQYVEYFVLTFMLFANVTDAGFRRTLLNVFQGVASVVIVVGVVQYLLPGTADFHVRATFMNRNVLGGYLSLVVPLMVGDALCAECPWRRARLLATAALALLVTLSGAAFLAIALSVAMLAAMRGRAAFLAAAAALVALVLLLPHMPRHNDGALNESLRLFNDSNEVSLRYTEWQAAAVMTAENPLLGVGIGNYQDNIGGYFGVLPRPTGVAEHDSENLYLVLASSAGLPGLALFLGVLLTFGLLAARAFATAPDTDDRGLAAGLLGAIAAFALCSVWSPLLVRGIGVQLAIVFALIPASGFRGMPEAGGSAGEAAARGT